MTSARCGVPVSDDDGGGGGGDVLSGAGLGTPSIKTLATAKGPEDVRFDLVACHPNSMTAHAHASCQVGASPYVVSKSASLDKSCSGLLSVRAAKLVAASKLELPSNSTCVGS